MSVSAGGMAEHQLTNVVWWSLALAPTIGLTYGARAGGHTVRLRHYCHFYTVLQLLINPSLYSPLNIDNVLLHVIY